MVWRSYQGLELPLFRSISHSVHTLGKKVSTALYCVTSGELLNLTEMDVALFYRASRNPEWVLIAFTFLLSTISPKSSHTAPVTPVEGQIALFGISQVVFFKWRTGFHGYLF